MLTKDVYGAFFIKAEEYKADRTQVPQVLLCFTGSMFLLVPCDQCDTKFDPTYSLRQFRATRL